MRHDLLHFPGPGPLYLGDLTARVELAVAGTSPFDAIALVDALLLDRPGSVLKPGEAARLAVADRDRLMASLHLAEFGSRIAGDRTCEACAARFSFDFDLGDLLGALAPSQAVERLQDGWLLAEGVRFRLPTGEDERIGAASGAKAGEVIALRCLPEGEVTHLGKVSQIAEAVAPLVDLTLKTTCPECGADHAMAFNAEAYFLGSLRARRARLMADIHRIASTYGWSYDSIVDLPQAHRQGFVDQITRDREAARRARRLG
ncbi:hypothetical protein [Tropicibacter sp. S64]|uniref:hypothetical protein n=1 Tax=Tropicibacter sp. S64 TaxID=3415122 RepID=UPI003C7A48D6